MTAQMSALPPSRIKCQGSGLSPPGEKGHVWQSRERIPPQTSVGRLRLHSFTTGRRGLTQQRQRRLNVCYLRWGNPVLLCQTLICSCRCVSGQAAAAILCVQLIFPDTASHAFGLLLNIQVLVCFLKEYTLNACNGKGTYQT